MELGVHLPLIDFGESPFTAAHLGSFAHRAAGLGFTTLAANDHLVFSSPWLDGLTALAAVIDASEGMRLATTVGLPVVRGPIPFAKSIAALDRLSGGRMVVGVGPGSSARDHELVGLDFDERWKRLDEAVVALRALWRGDQTLAGRYYTTADIDLLPRPEQPGGPPIWLGSWGSERGLRRVARLGDGWLASAYNTTPDQFATGLATLRSMLRDEGRDDDGFPNALATMWFHVADTAAEADEVLRTRLAPLVQRPEEVLRQRLLFGPAGDLVEKLRALDDAGVQQVLLWPVGDEERQIERFCERVRPELAGEP